MEKSFVNLDKTLLPWMGRTMKAIDFFMADFFQANGIGLTKAQMILLRVLTQNDGPPQNDLAFITNRDKTSLARLISTMENKNLVVRVQSKEDKRINHIHITKHGRSTMENAIPIIKHAIEVIQKDISNEELIQTINVLKKISKNINAEELTAPLNN